MEYHGSNTQYAINIPALVLSSLLSFLSVHSNLVEKPIYKWLNKQSSREKDLLRQKIQHKSEQSTISLTEQFAKYSKIQRKINAIDEELKEIRGQKPTSNLFMQLGFPYIVKIAIGILLVLFSIVYRYTPVFCLGHKVDLTPLTYIICYPNDVNCVSFYFWALCCAGVSRTLQRFT